MYESYFEFRSRPFATAPAASLYFPAGNIESAFQTLVRCIARGEGPAFVMGATGTGKSMLCHLLAQRWSSQFDVVQLSCAQLATARALLQSILYELGLPYRGLEEGELRLSLIDFLRHSEKSKNDGVLLLVDEAHTLDIELLEELRMLTNLIVDGEPKVRLVLIGGPKLEEAFASPKLDAFNQRIAARCYLHPLSYDETLDYAMAQIAAVGGDPQAVFTEDALQAVYHASDGIPRLINQVCDRALLLAMSADKRTIGAHLVEQAWADLQQLPPPSEPDLPEATPMEEVIEFGSLTDIPQGEANEEDEEDVFEQQEAQTHAIDLTDQLDGIEEQVAALEIPSTESDEQSDAPEDCVDDGVIELAPLADDWGDDSPVDQAEAASATADPFAADYEQEEIVVDRYALLDALASPDAEPSDRLAARVEELKDEAPEEPLDLEEEQTDTLEPTKVSVMREPPDDSDLIVLISEDGTAGRADEAKGNAYRQEYNQLFSRLRRS